MVEKAKKEKKEEKLIYERIYPINYILTPKNEFVIDFGRILTGYAEIRLKGRKGDKIVISYGEVLDKDGNFLSKNINPDKHTYTYILNGEKEETLKKDSSFLKFRYICLREFPLENVGDDTSFTAICVHRDIEMDFSFICGNEEINQLYRKIKWDYKNGFLDSKKAYEHFAHIFENASGICIDEEKGEDYKNIIIEPKADEKLGFVQASINTKFGKIEVEWFKNSIGVNYEIEIPNGVTALLKLPGRRVVEVEGGKYIFVCKK